MVLFLRSILMIRAVVAIEICSDSWAKRSAALPDIDSSMKIALVRIRYIPRNYTRAARDIKIWGNSFNKSLRVAKTIQGFVCNAKNRPFVHGLCTKTFVEIDCGLIPIENRPLHPGA